MLGQHEVPGIEDAAEPLSDSDRRWDDLDPAVGIAAALLIALPMWASIAWLIQGISLLRAAE